MKKIIICLLCCVLIFNSAIADKDNSRTGFFVGGEGGFGLVSYNGMHDNSEGRLGFLFSGGLNAGMIFGKVSDRYNFGFSGMLDAGVSPFPDIDDIRPRFHSAAIMFDNHIRAQKNWRRSLILSLGYGIQDLNGNGMDGGIATAFGLSERLDKNLDYLFTIRVFIPNSDNWGVNAGLRMGVRYLF